jgi:hypothetical protein
MSVVARIVLFVSSYAPLLILFAVLNPSVRAGRAWCA